MRVAAVIEYNGTVYHGFERQKNITPTVQQTLEEAFSIVANEPISITVAGRTDAGVHARGQVVHFDTNTKRKLKAWVQGANTYLPRDVSVLRALAVSDDFHVRFSAIERQYCYHIVNRSERVSIHADTILWVHDPLNVKAMHQGAQMLLGEHDFSAFRAASCQANSPFRCLTKAEVVASRQDIFVHIHGNAFLHHMVRNIVGSLLEVGKGRQSADWIEVLLASRDRTIAGPTAPARGLTLEAVIYNNYIFSKITE